MHNIIFNLDYLNETRIDIVSISFGPDLPLIPKTNDPRKYDTMLISCDIRKCCQATHHNWRRENCI